MSGLAQQWNWSGSFCKITITWGLIGYQCAGGEWLLFHHLRVWGFFPFFYKAVPWFTSSLTFVLPFLSLIMLILSEWFSEWLSKDLFTTLALTLAYSLLVLGLHLSFCEVAQFQTKSWRMVYSFCTLEDFSATGKGLTLLHVQMNLEIKFLHVTW